MNVAVTGATGRQGGAVARHLLQAGAAVRAIVRDAQSPAARALEQSGAKLMAADQGDSSSLRRAFEGVNGVFAMQPQLDGKFRTEHTFGHALADAARAAGVAHYVYSSGLGAGEAPEVSHFAAKAAIERHIESIGLPFTILRPGGFMENVLMPIVVKGLAKGKLTTPAAVDAPQQLIAVDDIGAFAALAFREREKHLGRTIALAGDVASVRRQAEVLSIVLGRPVKPAKLPGPITRLALGGDLYRMFRWIDQNGSRTHVDIGALRVQHPGLMTFAAWCERQFKGSHRESLSPKP